MSISAISSQPASGVKELALGDYLARLQRERAGEVLFIKGGDFGMGGPSDLSLFLGVSGEIDHPELVECVTQFIEACNRHGVVPGIHCRNAVYAKQWAQRGMRFVGAGGEHGMLLEKAKETVRQLRS